MKPSGWGLRMHEEQKVLKYFRMILLKERYEERGFLCELKLYRPVHRLSNAIW